jgi:hypothetical protein
MDMDLKSVMIETPEGANFILGQSHFIKSLEDLYEAIVTTAPGAKFGLAFAEASGPCLVRHDGNDEELRKAAVACSMDIGAGHTFVIFIRDAYPINVLNAIKGVQEVCSIFCATSNPVEVIVAQSGLGRGVLGVIDGSSPKGAEGDAARAERQQFLRKIGYKR